MGMAGPPIAGFQAWSAAYAASSGVATRSVRSSGSERQSRARNAKAAAKRIAVS